MTETQILQPSRVGPEARKPRFYVTEHAGDGRYDITSILSTSEDEGRRRQDVCTGQMRGNVGSMVMRLEERREWGEERRAVTLTKPT